MKLQSVSPAGVRTFGPYSPGIIAEGKILAVSGQGPFCQKEGRFICGTIAEQTLLTLENVRAILDAANADISQIISCRVYLQQLTESTFAQMNEAYAQFFGDHKPVRTTIGCQLLNIDVEIDVLAAL